MVFGDPLDQTAAAPSRVAAPNARTPPAGRPPHRRESAAHLIEDRPFRPRVVPDGEGPKMTAGERRTGCDWRWAQGPVDCLKWTLNP